jgi:hypothetical protein
VSTDSSIRLTPPTVADSSIPGIRHTSLGKGNVTSLHPEHGGRVPFRQSSNDPLAREKAGENPFLVEQRDGPPDRREEPTFDPPGERGAPERDETGFQASVNTETLFAVQMLGQEASSGRPESLGRHRFHAAVSENYRQTGLSGEPLSSKWAEYDILPVAERRFNFNT